LAFILLSQSFIHIADKEEERKKRGTVVPHICLYKFGKSAMMMKKEKRL
jgi:hypothetical protein